MKYEEEIKSEIRHGVIETLNRIEDLYGIDDCLETDEEREETFLFVLEKLKNEVSNLRLGIDLVIQIKLPTSDFRQDVI